MNRELPLPQNVEAERALLGSLVLDNRLLDDVLDALPAGAVLEAVKAFQAGADYRAKGAPDPLFFSPANQTLFGAMAALGMAGQGYDLTVLCNALQQRNLLQLVGGPAYVAGLEDDIFAFGQVPEYARIIAEHWRRRGLVRAGREMAERASGKEDVGQCLQAAEQAIFELSVERDHGDLEQVETSAREEMASIEAMARGETRPGVPTGFREIDRMIGGLVPDKLVLVAARPSMGKSALVANIAQNVAGREGLAVGFFSLEMSRGEVLKRMMARKARVPFGKVQGHYPLMNSELDALRQASAEIGKLPLYIDDTTTLTPTELRSKARRLKTRRPDLAAIVVDYVQLMETGGNEENRNLEVSQISRTLKKLAGELHVTVVALSQLSRDIEKRGKNSMPRLSDLRDSGALEQDADVVLFVNRPNFGKKAEPGKLDDATIRVGKQRNGAVGDLFMGFIGDYVEFVDVAAPGMK